MDVTSKISNLWLTLASLYLLMVLLDPGHLGSVDSERRLQTTHWLWGAGPSIIPGDDHGYIISGPDGVRHYWYGIGQSILMMPGDILGTLIANFAASFSDLPAAELDELREAFVALSTFPFIAALTGFVLYRLFCAMGVSPSSAIASVIVAFLATRLLYFSVIHQENSSLLLFSLSACLCLILWIQTNSPRYLLLAGFCFGFNLLTRLTTVFEIAIFGMFAAYLFLIKGKVDYNDDWMSRFFDVTKFLVPVLLTFLAFDRLYHFYRFEEWLSTYLDIQARRVVAEGTGPEGWPWITPFWEGFWSAFFSPMYGTILYDPLIFVTLYLSIFYRQKLSETMMSFIAFSFVLLLTYAGFYARYETPGGMPDWGNRYSATPIICITAFAYPMWLICKQHMRRVENGAIALLFLYSIFIQIMSVPFMFFLEIMQTERGVVGSRILLRMENVVCFFFGWPGNCGEGLFENIPPESYRVNILLFHAIDILNVGSGTAGVLVVVWSVLVVAVGLVLAWILIRIRDGRHAEKGGNFSEGVR